MGWNVGELAKVAGVSVRALHHYDELRLLTPSARTPSGYRLYDETDLQRLQQILFYRELEFPLEDIRRIMMDPAFDKVEALRAQRELLQQRARHARALVKAVDQALESLERGTPMNQDQMFEVFGAFDPAAHEAEVQQRWSGPLLDESRRRTSRYGKQDWTEAIADQKAIQQEMADVMGQGLPAGSPRAMAVAERHRLHIDRWFYPCSHQVQCGLGDMYVEDPRFAANYEKLRAGLAVFMRDAIRANAARQVQGT